MLKFNNIVLKHADKWLFPIESSDLNPLNLPPNTVRVRTSDGNPPVKDARFTTYETATLVSGTTDVYDVYKSGTFLALLMYSTNVIEVLGANTTSVTNMNSMFYGCSLLTSVPLFDTSSVTSMRAMFRDCTSLTSIPLFNTSNVTDMGYMFCNCYNVQSGALALYQQASTQANPPANHSGTFTGCGANTTTGAAELAQIPSDWK